MQQVFAPQNETACFVVSANLAGTAATVSPASDTTSAPTPTVEPIASITLWTRGESGQKKENYMKL